MVNEMRETSKIICENCGKWKSLFQESKELNNKYQLEVEKWKALAGELLIEAEKHHRHHMSSGPGHGFKDCCAAQCKIQKAKEMGL